MTEVTSTDFLNQLLAGSSTTERDGGWLKARRAQALERASALAVPNTRDEDWRFTDLSSLYRTKLTAATEAGALDRNVLRGLLFPETSTRLVFVDGCLDEEASSGFGADGITVASLRDLQANGRAGAWLERDLAATAHIEQDVFAAANTANLRQAAIVHIARNCEGDGKPIHVLYVTTGRDLRTNPRILVVAERGARCTVVEDYVAMGGAGYLTNSVCEIVVASNALVRHIKFQREAETAFHIGHTAVRMQADSSYRNWSISLGGRISRHNLNVVQAGPGIDCEVRGLAMLSGRQLADTHSSIDHAHPHGASRQIHKTITGGSGHAVFNGKIVVREGAQLTNASQQNRNLLLGSRAIVDAKPQLEIFADDVKCAHGATVGQVDADEMFYLKSRGLSESAARNLLTYAFAREVVEDIPLPSLVSVIESHILEQTRVKEMS